MSKKKRALILIGFQNDYFAKDGILRGVIEESSKTTGTLENTIKVVSELKDTLIISTPIIFSANYSELEDPVGILKTIKEVGAFKKGEKGAEVIPEIKQFKDKVMEIPGKEGLNAFVNTNLDHALKEHQITDVALAGVVCSICIDSTARSAHERGYNVTILSDCVSGRTVFEQQFYCEQVFPLYSTVLTSAQFLT